MQTQSRPRLALLIDAENVSAAHLPAILQAAEGHGDPAIRRVFGNWAAPGMASWAAQAAAYGLMAVHVPATCAGKNSSDIGLVIAAMDLLHSGAVDGFVIASSDSDFTGLALRLREAGKLVIGAGEGKTHAAFRAACSGFVVLGKVTKQAPVASKVPEAVTKALEAEAGQDGWHELGRLGHAIREADPQFRVKNHGHATLIKLLRSLPAIEVKLGEGGRALARSRAGSASAQ
jgi:hypothetical protein